MRRAWLWSLLLTLALATTARAAEPWETVPDPRPLPAGLHEHRLGRPGALIWYATTGQGSPVILLHCGDCSSDLWGGQVAALVAARHRVILIDTRGHGRSTWDGSPLHYETMADDVSAVMRALHIRRSAIVGWSDGAIVGLVMAMRTPRLVSRVYAFGANMDLNGFNLLGVLAPTRGESDKLFARTYARVAPKPSDWGTLTAAVLAMQLREPTYSADDLEAIHGPRIAIADGEHEEFIARSHTEYLARTIPGAKLVIVPGVSHFAPLQDPKGFNASMIGFLGTGPAPRPKPAAQPAAVPAATPAQPATP